MRGGKGIEDAAAQARAQPAHGVACGDHTFDDAVGVLLDDVVLNAERTQVLRHGVRRVARLLLIEMHGYQLEIHRRAFAQTLQDFEQGVGILATRQADHHPVAVLDHVEVSDRAPDLTAQPLLQNAGLVALFTRIGGAHAGA